MTKEKIIIKKMIEVLRHKRCTLKELLRKLTKEGENIDVIEALVPYLTNNEVSYCFQQAIKHDDLETFKLFYKFTQAIGMNLTKILQTGSHNILEFLLPEKRFRRYIDNSFILQVIDSNNYKLFEMMIPYLHEYYTKSYVEEAISRSNLKVVDYFIGQGFDINNCSHHIYDNVYDHRYEEYIKRGWDFRDNKDRSLGYYGNNHKAYQFLLKKQLELFPDTNITEYL